MNQDIHSRRYLKKSIYGFFAGFIATLTFHQFALWLLWGVKIAPFAPFNTTATQPWGIPAVFSLALWATRRTSTDARARRGQCSSTLPVARYDVPTDAVRACARPPFSSQAETRPKSPNRVSLPCVP